MAKNSIYDYSTTANSNTDIAGIGIQGTNAVLNFDDAFRTLMAQIATDISPRRMSIWGAIYGLTLSNNAGDATNDIDIAAGMATTDSLTDPRTMVLAAALTKRLDAAWAVGTGNGGLDTGSIANATYHVWLIQRSDTGVVDALFSTSATSPTMPTNYDRQRRIGSIIRNGGTILAFTQINDVFTLTSAVLNYSSASASTNILQSLTVPNGIQVQPIITGQAIVGVGSVLLQVGSAFLAAPSMFLADTGSTSAARDGSTLSGGLWTDTSGRIRLSSTVSGSVTSVEIYSLGWIDSRGR